MKINLKNFFIISRVMQSMFEISPSGLNVILNEKVSKIALCRNHVDSEDFIRNASMVFIDSINLNKN